ncbi:WYL domain-containing protein [Arthrobacter sp. FW306-2-2C-D06B]|uniref:WYL domain-containing protein n=1 Tax=Arthrobacter sp. FW306-2-2C-D06B TaxID=2879618 RepID=UPI003FA45551
MEEARAQRTVLITAAESDGSVETREIEPYSLRPGKPGTEPRLFGWCMTRNAIRSWSVSNIRLSVPTGNSFSPRWPVEF